MKNRRHNAYISSMEDLVKEKHALQLRLKKQETELRRRVNQVPGEIFYSSVDSFIPSFLSGRVSSFALNAGKGMINNFFVRKAAATGSTKLLKVIRPSGLMRKLGTAYKTILKKK